MTARILLFIMAFLPLAASAKMRIMPWRLPKSHTVEDILKGPGGYYLALQKTREIEDDGRAFFTPLVVHLDWKLDVVWMKEYSEEYLSQSLNIALSGSRLFVQGTTWKNGSGQEWVSCFALNGKLLWHHLHEQGKFQTTESEGIFALPHGQVLVQTQKYLSKGGLGTVYLTCIRPDGSKVWEHAYGTAYKYFIVADVVEAGEGAALISGHAYPTRVDDFRKDGKAVLIKIEAAKSGDVIWEYLDKNGTASLFTESLVQADQSVWAAGLVSRGEQGMFCALTHVSAEGKFVRLQEKAISVKPMRHHVLYLPHLKRVFGINTTAPNYSKWDDSPEESLIRSFDEDMRLLEEVKTKFSTVHALQLDGSAFLLSGLDQIVVVRVEDEAVHSN